MPARGCGTAKRSASGPVRPCLAAGHYGVSLGLTAFITERMLLVIPEGLPAAGGITTAGVPHAPTLDSACLQNPGIACRLVWDVTQNAHAAALTRVYLVGPVTLALRIGFVLALAVAARAFMHRAIKKVTAHTAEAGMDGSYVLFRERRRQRAQALGSILRSATSVLVFGIAGVQVAYDLGLNLAPVLASAGVLGLAIGFGAQSLVKDYLSGIFMLVEDQYGVGDVIDSGYATGTVEAVSLRVTRLRDVNGVVWHVRNGTVDRIGNESQGWARAVIDFPVGYQQNLSRVRRLMKQVATTMWEEPRWREVLLEEPEVWGVESISSDSVVMRLVAKTVPLGQWEVARELRERLKTALDAEDVPGEPVATALGAGSAAKADAQAHTAGQDEM
jgi:moderate conductance mechanosensitive channel